MYSWLFERLESSRYIVSRKLKKDDLWTYFGTFDDLTKALDAVEVYDTPPW